MSERESMPYDVLIVGAGPAGLSAAIRIKQKSPDTSVVILEKGSEVGAHILSGAVVDPKGLDELIPDWRDQDCPMAETPVTDNQHWIMSKKGKFNLPGFLSPGFMHNKGCYTGSLGNMCRWLGQQAENMGVEIFPGFAAAEILFNDDGSVKGVATGDMGVARDGSHKADYMQGMEIHAKYTLFAEGARGSLTKLLKPQFGLDADCEPQVYGIGLKELWDIKPENHVPGRVIHSQGWPLSEANGGAFLYHQANGQVALGFSVWLNYTNPYLSPFEEFQRWKTHPEIKKILEGGKRISYGARAISDGGFQSVPKLAFPGGALIGCTAGFLNVPRIKGTHTAMKSGMLAADAAVEALAAGREHDELVAYQAGYENSWIYKELRVIRNILPLVEKYGNFWGTMFSGINMWFENFGIRMPFTMKHHVDYKALDKKADSKKIDYPKPDGVFSFDRLSSVFLSNTNHAEDQPIHLQLKDADLQCSSEFMEFAGPSARYCPAGVYEWIEEEGKEPQFQINAQNCVHCKTCDIKDPNQNINWVTPEGGGGPNYPNM